MQPSLSKIAIRQRSQKLVRRWRKPVAEFALNRSRLPQPVRTSDNLFVMPLSNEERLRNINRALELMTLEVGDSPMYLAFLEHDKPPYTEIYSTTWRELEEGGSSRIPGTESTSLPLEDG